MFERFTERARRAVFFARYEASNYGNPVIGTEHLLLGMLREDRGLLASLPGRFDAASDIRAEIDSSLTRGERISTSVEIPLSEESKKVLNFAIEAADNSPSAPSILHRCWWGCCRWNHRLRRESSRLGDCDSVHC